MAEGNPDGRPANGRATRAAVVAEILTVWRFGLVGFAATGIHAVVALLLAVPNLLSPLVANFVAFLVAFAVSFAGHHLWSFPVTLAGQRRWRVRLLRFLVLALAGFAANSGALAAWLSFTEWPDAIGILLSLVLIPAVTYLGARLWAFADRDATGEPGS